MAIIALFYLQQFHVYFLLADIIFDAENIIISLMDNEIGMSEEVKLKVFEMFFKVDLFSKGSGLGLYIVKSLVEKLKGEVNVQSG